MFKKYDGPESPYERVCLIFKRHDDQESLNGGGVCLRFRADDDDDDDDDIFCYCQCYCDPKEPVTGTAFPCFIF